MEKNELILLDIFYEITNKNKSIIPFTEYLEIIKERMQQSTFTILALYSALLEKKIYIKNTNQDRFFITEKGISELTDNFIIDKLPKNEIAALISEPTLKGKSHIKQRSLLE